MPASTNPKATATPRSPRRIGAEPGPGHRGQQHRGDDQAQGHRAGGPTRSNSRMASAAPNCTENAPAATRAAAGGWLQLGARRPGSPGRCYGRSAAGRAGSGGTPAPTHQGGSPMRSGGRAPASTRAPPGGCWLTASTGRRRWRWVDQVTRAGRPTARGCG